MNNTELIKKLKENAENFSREQFSEIIELASRAYIDSQPFITEEEVAEETLNGFINQLRSSDKEFISRAKKKVMDLIP